MGSRSKITLAKSLKRIMNNLVLEDVTFHYSNNSRSLLKNYSKNYHGGTNVLVVGDNGSGKSTYGKLICGLFEPVSGRITAGEKQISKLAGRERILNAYYITQISQLQFISNTIEGEIQFEEKIVRKKFSRMQYDNFFLPNELSFNPFDLDPNEAWRFSLFLSTIIDPTILFVDEIPSGSNQRNLTSLKGLLAQRKAANKITFVAYQRAIRADFDENVYISKDGLWRN